MACLSSPAESFTGLNRPRETFRFRKYYWSGAHSTRLWKMRHSIHKSSVQCRSYASRSWVMSFGSMATERAMQNIEPCTKKRTRWSLHETMVLIAAKKKQELQLQKAGIENKLKGREKWEEIESICQEEGIERTAWQCRARWDRIMPIYLKIKDWEKRIMSEKASFWLMKPSERKVEGFQLVLDQEIFDALDEYSKQLQSCTTSSIDPSKERRVKEEYYVDEKQVSVSGADNTGYAQDTSSIGPHEHMSEMSIRTETKQEGASRSQHSTHWLLNPTQGKESLDDSVICEEKDLYEQKQIAIENMIDGPLNDSRVEEIVECKAGIRHECQVLINEDEVKHQGLCTHAFVEGQREETVVMEENKNLTYSIEKDKDSDREESGDSYNDWYQVNDLCTKETCVEEDKKADVEVYQSLNGSPSMTVKEEICIVTQELGLPGLDNFTECLERGMDPNTQERENNDKEHRGTNLFYATEQKVETADMTVEAKSGHKVCNDSFLNQLDNEVCQEKMGTEIQCPNAFTVDSQGSIVNIQGPVTDLSRGMVVHVNDSIEQCVISQDIRESSDGMTIEKGNFEHECLGTDSAPVPGEVPLMTDGKIANLVLQNESLLTGIENKETCNERKENDQKLGPGPAAGSSIQNQVAGTEKTLKAAAKEGNDKPTLPIARSEKEHAMHGNEFDDDVFTGIQSAISNITSNALQSIRRLFRR